VKKYILLIPIIIILLSGCSSKEVFTPQELADDWGQYKSLEDNIIDTSFNIAKLDNGKVLTNNGVLNIKVAPKYRVVSQSDGWIITSSMDGNLTLTAEIDPTLQEQFALKKTVASASVHGDTLAVLFADNEMALYSISTKDLLLKEQGGQAIAVDSRIVYPYFMDDLVLFSTLDGKVIIINSKAKKKLRTTIVSSEDNFNNIIYFNIIENKIVAATAHKILSMSQKEIREKYEIRNIAYNSDNLFITTKQGEIISLTPELEVNAKLKFPFAHFLGLIISNDKIYALEKEGYIIESPTDLSTFSVYDVDIDEGFVFVADKMFYVNDKYISVE